MVGAFQDEVVPEQARGGAHAQVHRVPGAIRGVHFDRRDERRGLGAEGDRAAEGAVAVGRGAHAALDLDAAHQGAVGVHIGPEDRLVLRGVERHAVEGDVDAGAARAADAHIAGARAHAVLAPGDDAGRAGEEHRKLDTGGGEVLQLAAADVGHGEGGVLGGAHGADHDLLQLLDLQGIRRGLGRGGKNAEGPQDERHRGVQQTFVHSKSLIVK